MINEIQTYLQQPNPEFNSGFALFCKYSPNRILIESIGRRHDREMLLYELRKLSNAGFVAVNSNAAILQSQASQPVAVPVAQSSSAENAVHPQNSEDYHHADVIRPQKSADYQLQKRINFRTYDDRRTRRSDLPPEMQVEFDANSADYSVRRALHEKMKMATTDSDRASLRARILETQKRINERWKKIDDYLAAAAEETQATAFNEKSARAYISKALKVGTVTDRKAAGVKARVKALLDHGCNISDETVKQLKEKHLI